MKVFDKFVIRENIECTIFNHLQSSFFVCLPHSRRFISAGDEMEKYFVHIYRLLIKSQRPSWYYNETAVLSNIIIMWRDLTQFYQCQAQGEGGGVGHRVGILTFSKKIIIKIPTPGQKIIVQIVRNIWFTYLLLFELERSNA